MARYSTATKRRVGSADMLSLIEGYYDDKDTLYQRASMTLSNLLDESYTDYKYRNICVACSSQIWDSYQEGRYLSGLYTNPASKAYRWIARGSYGLASYSFVRSVKDSRNNSYDGSVDDVSGVFDMFKPYSAKRDDFLRDYDGVFDDGCVRQRHLTWITNTYENVLRDVDMDSRSALGITFYKGITKHRQRVITETEFHEKDTDPEPSLPTVAEFRGLVTNSSSTDSARYYFERLCALRLSGGKDEDWYRYVHFSTDLLKSTVIEIEIHDDSFSEDFADTVMKSLGSTLYLQSKADPLTYACVTVLEKEKAKKDYSDVKPAYSAVYGSASSGSRSWVYDHYKDIYWSGKYYVKLTLWADSYFVNTPSSDIVLSETVSEQAYLKVAADYLDQGLTKLQRAYSIFREASETTRCLDGSPLENYPRFVKILQQANATTADGINAVKDYISANILPWIKERTKNLLAQTTDDNNAQKFISALAKRLNKNTGTAMLWYQNVLSADQEIGNLEKSRQIVATSIKGSLVCRAVDAADTSLYKYQTAPNYIDVEPRDAFYDEYRYSFKKGDTVYIMDDTHPELKAAVTRTENRKIKVASYDNVTIDSAGDLMGAVTQTKNIVRLYLSARLPDWYCMENDVSSLRVMKII